MVPERLQMNKTVIKTTSSKPNTHEYERPPDNVKKKGIMVDAGATSHIVNDIRKFKNVDSSFQPETHSVELADGTKCSGMAQRRATAVIYFLDDTGRHHKAQLRDALYMPSYPHDIFSVARATNGGATITFKKGGQSDDYQRW